MNAWWSCAVLTSPRLALPPYSLEIYFSDSRPVPPFESTKDSFSALEVVNWAKTGPKKSKARELCPRPRLPSSSAGRPDPPSA